MDLGMRIRYLGDRSSIGIKILKETTHLKKKTKTWADITYN